MQRADGQPEVRRQGSTMTKEDQEAALVNKITTTGTNVLFFILLTHVGDVRGKRVAETGCGNGRGTLLLSQAVGDKGIVLASDVVPLMAVKAREEIQRAGVRNVVVDTAGG